MQQARWKRDSNLLFWERLDLRRETNFKLMKVSFENKVKFEWRQGEARNSHSILLIFYFAR
jgi:hypothetical protein